MNIPLPQYVYKYRCVDADSLSLLAQDKLYLARVESFNDPFEFPDLSTTVQATSAADPMQTYAKLDTKRRADNLHASMRVCSLTAEPQNLLMWGHYTDCHRGFCIRFDFRQEPQLRQMLFPVTYAVDYPVKSVMTFNELMEAQLLTKSADWSYEREWRIIGHVPEERAHAEEMFVPYTANSITGIIFGLRTPDRHKQLIRTVLARHTHIEYFQTFKQHDAFVLAIREIESGM